MTRIRHATGSDRKQIAQIYFQAFAEDERESVSALALNLLQLDTLPPTLSLVADLDGDLCGHIAFSPVTVNGRGPLGYILAPLAVSPRHQGKGIGKQLIQEGLALLSEQALEALFVYGDPDFYGRFGFDANVATAYLPPYPLHYPFGWQALAMHKQPVHQLPVQLTCVDPLMDPQLW